MVPLTEKPGDGGRSVVEDSLELRAHDARVNKPAERAERKLILDTVHHLDTARDFVEEVSVVPPLVWAAHHLVREVRAHRVLRNSRAPAHGKEV